MKKWYWVIVLVVVLLGLGYVARNRIRRGFDRLYGTAQTQTGTALNQAEAGNNAGGLVTMRADPNKGSFMAGPNGMSLYTFDKDTAGQSNCYGGCASLWPPFVLNAGSTTALPANFSTITRTDSGTQYTYKGMPLYYYSPDKQPGDTLGDGVGGVWHLAKP